MNVVAVIAVGVVLIIVLLARVERLLGNVVAELRNANRIAVDVALKEGERISGRLWEVLRAIRELDEHQHDRHQSLLRDLACLDRKDKP